MIIHGPRAIENTAAVPWKNGRGTTRTLASYPAHSTLENFVWRISLATIDADAAFSTFPGVDRTILLWSGNGVVLHRADGDHNSASPDEVEETALAQQADGTGVHGLTNPYESFHFRGEELITASLVEGPTTDLNLMLARGAATGSVHLCDTTQNIQSPCSDLLVFCARGALEIVFSDQTRLTLQHGDFLHLQTPALPVQVNIDKFGPLALYICINVIKGE